MSRLRKSLRWLLVLAAICAVTWIVTLAWWQRTHRAVDEADVLLFIVLIPIAAFVALLGVRFAVLAIRQRAAAASAPATVAQAAPVASEAASAHADRWRGARLHLHAAALTSAAGPTPDALLAALVENQPLAKPAADQFDLDGFRIPLVRIEALDLATIEPWLESEVRRLDAAQKPADDEMQRVLRGLAALAPALDDVAAAVDILLQPLPAAPPAPPPRPSAVVARPAASIAPRLLAVALVPHTLGDAALALVRAWLEPRLRPMAESSGAPIQLRLLPTHPEEPPLALLERFNIEQHEQQLRDVLLLIGIDSLVDPVSLQLQEQAGTLRTATRPQGQTPGEAACVLVLTSDFALDTAPPPLAALHRAGHAQRVRPPEHRGKVSSAALRDATHAALAIAGVAAEACGTIVCDGDGFGPRGIEAAETISALFESLDPVADRLALANVLGELGAATLPMLLAAAAAQVAASGKPCVIAPLASALDRHVLLAVPPTAPEASDPAHPTNR